MAKKNPQSNERRAMVEKMRAEQKRKEKLRGFGILGFCIVIVIAVLVAALIPYLKDRAKDSEFREMKIDQIGVTESAAACDPVKKESAEGSGKHLDVGTPITYKAAPPAFGEHWGDFPGSGSGSAPTIRQFYAPEDRPAVEYLVHSQEHGHTIAWYDETVTKDSKAYKDLEAMAKKLGSGSEFMAAPWTKADGAAFPEGKHVALTHWTGPEDQQGVWQYCGAPSGTVVKKFMKDYPKSSSPEPNAP